MANDASRQTQSKASSNRLLRRELPSLQMVIVDVVEIYLVDVNMAGNAQRTVSPR